MEFLGSFIECYCRRSVDMNLRYLNEHGCIEKIAHVDKSRSYWNVENFENIKNIRSEFEDVKLNGYEKGIILVLQKNGYRVTDLGGFFTYIQLLLSKSFFNACIDTSIDILSSRVGNIYHYYNAGFYRQMVENSRECYIAFSERYPNIKISGSDFAHILNEISGKHREFSSNEEFINIWKEKI
jgi:glutaredoxin-related protein